MKLKYRRLIAAIISSVVIIAVIATQQSDQPLPSQPNPPQTSTVNSSPAIDALKSLAIKGRSPLTGYSRDQFGDGWRSKNGCDTRNIILNRDLQNVVTNDECQVVSGLLHDPYTGKDITFERGISSANVQIDHVVALADTWQTGAQKLDKATRINLANDPLELLAVDGPANQQKGGSNAASWLPSNKSFRCQYVARQIAVKQKYTLWVTQPEYDAMVRILANCPGQALPKP